MKKLILVIFLLFLTFPAIGDAAYLIHLKNGGEFTTFRYWSDGDEIKLYVTGGIVGISKDSVRKIEKTELIYEERTASPEKSPDTVPAEVEPQINVKVKDAPDADAKEEEVSAAGTAGNETKSKEIDVAYHKRGKKALMEKYRQTREKLEDARNSRNKAAIRDVKKEIKEINNQLTDLALKLKEENNGMLPIWWAKEE